MQGWLNTGAAARERFAGRVHPKAESGTDSRSAVAFWLCGTFTELCPWLHLAPSLTCAIPARSLPGMSRSAVCLSAALIQAVQSALPSVQRRLIASAGAGCCTGKTALAGITDPAGRRAEALPAESGWTCAPCAVSEHGARVRVKIIPPSFSPALPGKHWGAQHEVKPSGPAQGFTHKPGRSLLYSTFSSWD